MAGIAGDRGDHPKLLTFKKSWSAIRIRTRTAATSPLCGACNQATRTLAARIREAFRLPCRYSTAVAVPLAVAADRRSPQFAPSLMATVRGRIRITEQGEIIAAKYGTQRKCRQQPRVNCGGDPACLAGKRFFVASQRTPPRFAAAMDDISSKEAFRAYRSLVYETEGFATFFRQSTPLLEISELKIGSRPASRTNSRVYRGPLRIPGRSVGRRPA